ncbi:hypothetical protein GWK08_16180 [Leptobacterium flavescens]|uniref:Uncharacterized protein n=1 Tax=Leptobacterium flavescens TaxID=472055 RepID=A0A6P0UNV3_9FLAO|nr:hypothetical protein [Leptobacterium flavescens]NER14994.1 hypothetical protein [Leptobacterium flavescens]
MKKQTVGRKLGKMHYVHRSAVSYLAKEQRGTLTKALQLIPEDTEWNLAKVSLLNDSVSLLYYKGFDTELFPVLTSSLIIKLDKKEVKSIDYEKRENPPVLHRKELFLPPDDPRIGELAAVTCFCEEKGLFKQASYIGTIRKWEQRLKEYNYKVEGMRIVLIGD